MPLAQGRLRRRLVGLPLALDHAAAYCKRTQMRFDDYANKASSLIDAAPRGAGYPRSVAATFDLAIAEAVAQCKAAEALMAYLAQCAPERIPMTLVEGAVEDEAERLQSARRACRSLAREARPVRGRHSCSDRASSRAGGGTSAVGGEWFGAGCRRATDCAAAGDLPGGRLHQSAVVAAVRVISPLICLARRWPDDASAELLELGRQLFPRARSLLARRAAIS